MRTVLALFLFMHSTNSVIAQDYCQESIDSLKVQAENGDAEAQYELGGMHAFGEEGVPVRR